MAVPVNDLHKDIVFQHQGEIYQVLEYAHKNIARGKADIKIKAKNLSNYAHVEVSFKSGQTVEEVSCHQQDLQYIYYQDRQDKVVLADPKTKKRISVDGSLLSVQQRGFLEEGSLVRALIRDGSGQIILLTVPVTVELTVEQAPPAEKGDTATGGSKPVVVSTGATIQVPMFIKTGDIIKINTDRGEYMERVSKQ